jgi:hypothetical protein
MKVIKNEKDASEITKDRAIDKSKIFWKRS